MMRQGVKWRQLLTGACLATLACGLVFYFVVFIYTAYQGIFFHAPNGESHSDYLLWYAIGRLALSPERHLLYDEAALFTFWNQVISPASVEAVPCYIYPPFSALLFSPFSLMPLDVSYLVWSVFTLAAGLLALVLLLSNRRIFSRQQIAAFLLVTLAVPGSLISIRIGQLSWFYLASIGFFYWCFQRRRDWSAGACLALLSTKPHYFVFTAIPALAGRRWRMLLAFAVLEGCLLVAAGSAFGWRTLLEYPGWLMSNSANPQAVGPQPERMITLRLLFGSLLPPESALAASLLTLILSWLFLYLLWWRTLERKPDLSGWAMGLTVVTSLVVSAHSHVYDTLLLAVAVALTVPTTNLFTATKAVPLTVRLWTCGFIVYALGSSLAFFLMPDLFRKAASPLVLAMNLFLLVCAAGYLTEQLTGTACLPKSEPDGRPQLR